MCIVVGEIADGEGENLVRALHRRGLPRVVVLARRARETEILVLLSGGVRGAVVGETGATPELVAAPREAALERPDLSDREIDVVAEQLNVKREEVIEMETRLSGGDVLLDPAPSDDGEQAFGPIAYLSDRAHEPTAMIESRQRDALATDGITTALESLDERSRRIVEERWLKVNDDGSGGMTLHELAAVYGMSAERIRQIEAAAMKKMKKALAEYA